MEITVGAAEEQLAHEIQSRIKQLSELAGTDLKTEMDDLRVVLLKNPAACSLLVPEDLGMAIASIKRMVSVAVETKAAKPAKPAKPTVKLTMDLKLEDE